MDFLRIIRAFSAGVLVLMSFQSPVRAQAPEYEVKAAMLHRFALFVDWPAKAFSTAASPFFVCVVGGDPFGPWLRHEMGGTRIGTHPVEIRYPGSADAGYCQMIFICRSEQRRLEHVMMLLRSTNALLVSDMRDIGKFCRKGGMIGLIIEDNKVRFELNSRAAARKGFKIDSRMQRIAASVTCGEVP